MTILLIFFLNRINLGGYVYSQLITIDGRRNIRLVYGSGHLYCRKDEQYRIGVIRHFCNVVAYPYVSQFISIRPYLYDDYNKSLLFQNIIYIYILEQIMWNLWSINSLSRSIRDSSHNHFRSIKYLHLITFYYYGPFKQFSLVDVLENTINYNSLFRCVVLKQDYRITVNIRIFGGGIRFSYFSTTN